MSFYIRKSVSVGPFRFNLSKSGVGVSTGIKGLRIGTGPRGNYVHMGGHGVYFRQTIPSHGASLPKPPLLDDSSSSIEMRAIESGDVAGMTDSTSAELLQEIRRKAQLTRIWPIMIAIAIAVLGLMLYNAAPAWTYWISIPASIAAILGVVVIDKIRKTVVLFYELEPHIEEAYQRLHNSFVSLRECSCVWHVTSSGRITSSYDKKRNAGASAVVRRNRIFPGTAIPPYFKCNVAIPALSAGRQTLYFLPDRLLVWDSQDVGAITYDQLQVNVTEETFVEEERIPADGKIVGSTWKYVNQKGGPDRRFKDNRELPLLRYEAIFLVSPSGLQELFQASCIGIGYQVNYAVSQMASAIARRDLQKPKESFIKCTCNSCAGSIEFPSTGIGQFIDCPHCGLQTRLFQPVY